MNHLVHKIAQPTLSVISKQANATTQHFPIHRIYCVGRNYREHAIEMGGDPDREPPFFFQKPADAAIDTTSTAGNDSARAIPYPPMTTDLHHEVELVVAIGTAGRNIPVEHAERYIYGYAIGCDLTRRDLQSVAKKARRPWADAKGFDYSAPCGPIVPKEDAAEIFTSASTVPIELQVNGETRQKSTLDRCIWNIPETVSFLSKFYLLQPGDLIMTGTPAGVGPVVVGDSVKATCGDLPPCVFTVAPPEE